MKEKIKSPKLIAMISLLILVLLVILNAVLMPSTSERVINATEAVNNLYVNKEKALLYDQITEEHIAKVERQITKLPPAYRDELLAEFMPAAHQFEAIEMTEGIFGSNPLSQGNNLLINSDITVNDISASQERVISSDNLFKNDLLTALSEAEAMVHAMDELEREFTEVKNYGQITRSNLPDVLERVNTLSEEGAVFTQHPYFAPLTDDYEQYINHLVATILNGYEYGPFDERTVHLIQANKDLMVGLKGSDLNPSPTISVTFDDGPNPDFTPQILDILAQYDVKATFFVYGAYVDQYPELARRIVDEGHLLGNHTYTHPDLSKLSDEEVLQEIQWTQDSIRDVTGHEPDIYRMPFGAGGPRVVRLLPELTSITWNLDSLDWELQDEDLIYNNVKNQLSNDTLLLMHDTNQATVNAVARILPELVEDGYDFVKPTEVEFSARYFE